MSDRLFHDVTPTPQCCGRPMARLGNMALHTLAYKCGACRDQILVTAAFTENHVSAMDAEAAAATDATE